MSITKWGELSEVATGGVYFLGVVAFCGAVFASLMTSSVVYADGPEVDQVNIIVPVSCTLDGVGMNSHIANINNRDFETEIGSTTLTAYCNDVNGFSIYAIGYSNDEYGNTDMIGINTEELIHTGTTLDGTTSNWAMKLSTDPNATYPVEIQNSYNNYKVVPTTYTLVAKRESSTDLGTAAVGSILTTTYAASVSPTQVADTYVGKVRYTLVHPVDEAPLQPETTDPGKICYYANARTYEGTMGCQEIVKERDWSSCYNTDNSTYCYDSNWNEISIETLPELDTYVDTYTLLASNFSRTGYGFAGWSTTFDYSDSTGFYGPQETITLNTADYSGTNKGLSLYAHWIKSAGNIQGWTGCNSLASGAVTALTDQRDNNTYAIAKLADGKCWMIENLRLESTAEHNSDGTLAQGYGTSATYGNFGGLADAESSGFSNTYTANSLYYSGTQSGDATINIGTTNYPGYRMPRYNNWNNQSASANRPQNPTTNSATNSTTNAGMYSYGNYYTWHAAIADLTYNGTNNQSTTGTSLCPSGWHLPKGGNKSNEANNELWSLVVDGINGGTKPANYGSSTQPYYDGTPEGSDVSNKLRAYPNNFLYSGVFFTSSVYSRGSYGYYWSSTAYNGVNSYSLYLYSSYVHPGPYDHYKYNGQSIRCTVGS